MSPGIARPAAAEAIGTAFLLAAVVGSGIMAERLAGGNVALALLANAIATGAALYALILAFSPISGAHLNPLVTLAAASAGDLPWRALPPYMLAQLAGAVADTWIAHLMFALPILQTATRLRGGAGQWAGELLATFGLILVIESGKRHFPAALAGAVADGDRGARALSDSFAGIAPASAPAFIAAQTLGAVAAIVFWRWLAERR